MRIHAKTGIEGKMLDIQRDIKRQLLSAGPGIRLALVDRDIVITPVAWQFQHLQPLRKLRPGSPLTEVSTRLGVDHLPLFH
jgi:hypothetical protein